MRSEVIMPQMGESVTEGTVTQWLKKVGEYVERDEPLFEITTDKVDAEIPCPVAGVLVECMVEPGQTVEINTVVAIVETEAKAGDVVAPAASDTPVAATPAPAVADMDSAVTQKIAVPAAASAPASVSAGSLSSNGAPTREELRRTRSTPLVRRIASEHGVEDISAISGSGLSGRVTKKDILQFIAEGRHEVPRNGYSAPAPGITRQHKAPAIQVGPRDRVVPMGPQRLAIAEHMVRSLATSAHAHTVHEVDFSRVVKAREALKTEFASRDVKLTYTAFMVKAAAEALVEFPLVNASVDGENIVYRGDVNVGVAVALEGSLIVPVVRNVDELSLLGVARSIDDLATRARTKRLKFDEVQGGTFTLSNHGIYGPEFGVPVINQPQTAIMSTGAIKKRVVVDQETDAILIRPTCIWCMSFDHRLIDGATADMFMARMREIIETWDIG
ncbi:MAG: dihydrolipoamide acetyltransferase family protein [Bradymonadaceae bacterium]